MKGQFFHEFRVPIPVRVLENPARSHPSGKAAAYGFFLPHLDWHVTWFVCFDEGGQFWQIENPWVRGDPNPTWGRTLTPAAADRRAGPAAPSPGR